MFKPVVLFLSLVSFSLFAQEFRSVTEADSLYREDQFYIGLNYNLLVNKPDALKSEGFSGGFYLGFLRDMPVNERRNVAVAFGLGYSFNKYGHNLFIGKNEAGESFFVALDDSFSYDSNRFVTHEIEVPLEFRWRTSTPQAYKFWRVYAGLKFGYVYYFKSSFIADTDIRHTTVPEFERFRTGATLSFGYNTFNFQIYYSLNPFFKEEAKINGEPIDLSTIKVGLIFYIL